MRKQESVAHPNRTVKGELCDNAVGCRTVRVHALQTTVRDGQDFKRRDWTVGYYGEEIEGTKKATRQTRTAEPTCPNVGYDENGHASHPKPKTPQLAA